MNQLSVRDVKVHYPLRRSSIFRPKRVLKAVDGVSFELAVGEILGIVGESGCGKSSLARAILRLVNPTGGQVFLNGADFFGLSRSALREARRDIQMVFQDPYSSLNPRMTVFDTLTEPLRAHRMLDPEQMTAKVSKILELVGLSTKAAQRFPHEFSGGQRQRIAIARALILEPKVLIADEPVSALDVSVQAQILNLLREIQQELRLSIVFISHNLGVVRYISDRIAVMYLGRIVEEATRDELFQRPLHPYTRALISAVPIPHPALERARIRVPLVGEPPSAVKLPPGCAFQSRCPIAKAHCNASLPPLEEKHPRHLARCFEIPVFCESTKAGRAMSADR